MKGRGGKGREGGWLLCILRVERFDWCRAG